MFWTVLKPISGRKRPNAISAATQCRRERASETGAVAAGDAASPSHTFSTSGPAEDALRQEDHGDREDRKGGDVLVVDRQIGRPQGLDQADQQSAEHGAGQRADAAEHRGGERLHAGHEAVGEADDAIVHQVERAGDGGERGGDHEGDRDGAVDIDAEQRRHLLILLAGALRTAKRGLGHQEPEPGQQHGRHHPDRDLLVGHGDVIAAARHQHDDAR